MATSASTFTAPKIVQKIFHLISFVLHRETPTEAMADAPAAATQKTRTSEAGQGTSRARSKKQNAAPRTATAKKKKVLAVPKQTQASSAPVASKSKTVGSKNNKNNKNNKKKVAKSSDSAKAKKKPEASLRNPQSVIPNSTLDPAHSPGHRRLRIEKEIH